MKTLLAVLALALAVPTFAEEWERVLFPIVLNGVAPGAYGSQWGMELSIYYTGKNIVPTDPQFCPTLISPCIPAPLTPNGLAVFIEGSLHPFSAPASFFNVPSALADDIHFNLHVRDLSRSSETFGTEIPVVRTSEFRTTKIALLNVPVQPPFRTTLRLYHAAPTTTTVRVRVFAERTPGFIADRTVTLSAAQISFKGNPLVPGYAQIGDLLDGAQRAGIERAFVEIVPGDVPVWGFISVTNSITQQVTLVTPQRMK